MRPERIPETDSIEELARFWDTHDLTDFEDELEEVTEPVFQKRTDEVVRIRLRADEVEAVEKIARGRGTSARILLHDWIVDKLQTVAP